MSALTAVYFIPMIKKKDAAYHARTIYLYPFAPFPFLLVTSPSSTIPF